MSKNLASVEYPFKDIISWPRVIVLTRISFEGQLNPSEDYLNSIDSYAEPLQKQLYKNNTKTCKYERNRDAFPNLKT